MAVPRRVLLPVSQKDIRIAAGGLLGVDAAKDLAAKLSVPAPVLKRIAVDGLTPEGEPFHAAERSAE